jgi:hypothetical protein
MFTFTLQTAFAVLLGVISSLIVAMFVEWQRKPRLIVSIPPVSVQPYPSGQFPCNVMSCARIRVRNQDLPSWLRWMRRESAENCLATIRFLYLDGTSFFKDPMPGRWAGSPEATPLRGSLHSGHSATMIEIWDTSRLSIISKIDIPAGEQEDLDIAVRCDNDVEAYGYNNDSYQHAWKNKNWMLPKGRFIVEVTIRSAGEKMVRRFRLNNDLTRDQFRLEEI